MAGNATGTPALPLLGSEQLLSALSSLQGQAGTQTVQLDHAPSVADVRQLVLTQGDGSVTHALGQADDDTVNFVSMLFDYILNDRNLAIPMKALIARLQIPIVKLAVLDKSFFARSNHPARVLLNELSSAGIGWSSAKELKRDALYDLIESIVSRVLSDFASDADVFTALTQELRAFVNKDKKRSVLVEQRVKESEQGKAQTNEAKQAVQRLINQKAAGLRLPKLAGQFVSDTWSRVLTLRWVKYGEGSPEWMGASATLDDLLWVLQPMCTEEELARRESLAGPLLDTIGEGMTEVGVAEAKVSEFLAWLHEHLATLTSNDRSFLDEDERPLEEDTTAPMEEIVLTTVDIRAEEAAPVAPEFLERLKAITEGTWVEVTEAGKPPLRCKLATITQPGSLYVFVNRRGMKVLEKNRVDMATLLKEDQLKLIDESQVFDRALQSVIGNLRQLQRQTT